MQRSSVLRSSAQWFKHLGFSLPILAPGLSTVGDGQKYKYPKNHWYSRGVFGFSIKGRLDGWGPPFTYVYYHDISTMFSRGSWGWLTHKYPRDIGRIIRDFPYRLSVVVLHPCLIVSFEVGFLGRRTFYYMIHWRFSELKEPMEKNLKCRFWCEEIGLWPFWDG